MANVKINDLSLAGSVSSNMQFETDTLGATANKVTATQIKTFVLDSLSHGTLTDLGVDDHTQYSLADGTRWTTVQTASRVPVTDASGYLVVSSTTATELGFLDATSSIQTQLNSKYDSDGDIDHGGINGLADDDHTQYALADGTRWTTTNTPNRVPISDGSGNLVVSSVTDTQLSYLDATSSIQTQLNNKYDTDTDVDHDSTTNFLANEHINHTSVSISAGTGISGGGDISSSRTINLDIDGLTVSGSVTGSTDYIPVHISGTGIRKVLIEDLPSGGGGSSTFVGLTDTPANFTSQASKVLAVNSGETAVEFIDAPSGVTSGSTLPSTPTDGQFHLHTPTGRTWLMQYDGSDWYPVFAYGTTTIYMTNSSSGSTDWDDGHSSGTALSCNLLLPNLPGQRKGTITVICSAVAFTTSDIINLPPGLSGAGDIVIQGDTTTEVASTTYSSGSAPYQSWTMSASVGGGSEGDILEYVSGTLPDNPMMPGQDVWCVLSVSGSTINLPGGVMSLIAPSTDSVFCIKSRNTSWTLDSETNFKVFSSNVIFKYISFTVGDGTGKNDYPVSSFPTTFVGCGFDFIDSGLLRTISKWQFIGCYLTRTDNTSRFIIFAINDMPLYIIRSLIKSTSTNSVATADILTCQGRGINKFLEVGGCRIWHTQSGARLGKVEQQAHLRLRRASTNSTNYTVVGGGSASNWDVNDLSIISGTSDVTKSGTSGSIASVDATSLELTS